MEKKNLVDLLNQLVNPKERKGKKLTRIIHQLIEQREYFCYHLICYFLNRYQKTGYLKAISKNELLEHFSVGKSQLTLYLQKAREQGIINYESRKYSLNTNHPLAQRLLSSFFTEGNLNSNNEIISLLIEQDRLKEELVSIQYQRSNSSKPELNLDSFCGDIMDVLRDNGDKERYKEVCEKYKHLLVGLL